MILQSFLSVIEDAISGKCPAYPDGMTDHVVEHTHTEYFFVSTVWLFGINYGHGGGPPLYFETMVFPENKANGASEPYLVAQAREKFNGACHRYTTKSEAQEGHNLVVAYILDLEKQSAPRALGTTHSTDHRED